MVSEAELTAARAAGSRYKAAISSVRYDAKADQVTLRTRVGDLTFRRTEIPYFRDVPPQQMVGLYVSQTGLHIDAVDLDVSSDGLLELMLHQKE
jgi:hypothetical protein